MSYILLLLQLSVVMCLFIILIINVHLWIAVKVLMALDPVGVSEEALVEGWEDVVLVWTYPHQFIFYLMIHVMNMGYIAAICLNPKGNKIITQL